MKTIIAFSDSHGDKYALSQISDRFNDVDYIFFLGDGLNDLNVIKELYPDKLFAVKGNCDTDSSVPKTQIVQIENSKIALTHGDLFSVKYSDEKILKEFKDYDAVFFGHTHSFSVRFDTKPSLINVPSLSSFKSSKPAYVYAVVNDKRIFAKPVYLF